jgi:polyisoprenoid-binding protein YceI
MKNALRALGGLALLAASPAHADWSLSSDESQVAFASIKKDTVGEVHHFSELSGSVDAEGNVTVDIAVASLETWIDIRNERMLKAVLNASPTATLSGKVDLDAMEKMKPGDTELVDIDGTLTLNGTDMDVDVSLFVARLTDDKMMAVTDEMIMLSTEDAGIDEGVSTLMKLADLPGITRVSPVTLRLVFTR